MTRVFSRQINRVNISPKHSETHYLFLLLYYLIIQKLHIRFNQRLSDIMSLMSLIQQNCNVYDYDKILKASTLYVQDLLSNDTSQS